jgi:hypothetical protein
MSMWSHVISVLAWCVVYYPFQPHPWALPFSVAVSYTAFVFSIAVGLSMNDISDFFGDLRVPRYVATLLLPHSRFLAPIMLAAYLWQRVIPMLPAWVTARARPMPLWVMCGVVPLFYLGRNEGISMADKIKRRCAHFAE